MSHHIPTHIKEHSIYDAYYNDNNPAGLRYSLGSLFAALQCPTVGEAWSL